MAQRSSGIFPREGFNLDDELEITASPVAAVVTLSKAKTIRVIVLGADYTEPVGDGEDGNITVKVGGQNVVFGPSDFDGNGVGIAHIRGALCDGNNNVDYDLNDGADNTGTGGSFTVSGVFYELVDGPAK
jgi:hypothetical protein